MENGKEGFHYSYSAEEQKEIKNIRQKYMPKEVDKMEQLRKLDQSATRKGMVASMTSGVVGTFLFGIGLCCCMVWAGLWFVPGIVIGVAGMVAIALAYPLYNHLTVKERERIAPEIIRLTDELMK